MKNIFYLLLIILTASCGISEDCFKGNGAPTTLAFPLEDFTKVKVYSGVGLVVKEGPEYEVRIETRDNIKDNIEVNLEGDMLIVKDNSTCNVARDYGVTTVYITAPNLEEIHSKTEQDIKSDGVLHFPELKLYALGDDGDGAGTGDFYLEIDNVYSYFESNSIANFFIKGKVNYLDVIFTWGDGCFNGDNLIITNKFLTYHRGSNNIIINPNPIILEGEIYSLGNIVLKRNPFQNKIIEYYIGKVIYDY